MNAAWQLGCMSRPTPFADKTRNWPAHNEALRRRGSLMIWFDLVMAWAASPTGKRSRQPDQSGAAIQTCLTMKVLFPMPLRRTTGFVESVLRLIGLNWAMLDFRTLSRRQKSLTANIPCRGSDGPLHLLIDRDHSGPQERQALDARDPPGPLPATISCRHPTASAGASGDHRAEITAEAAQRPR